MPFNTFGVATAVTPSVIETYFSHYLNRGPLKQKPTAHISYHEGLRLIRQFLDYSSKHSVEDLQSFTAQWVPAPTWVRTQDVEIPPQFMTRSANVLRKQLGDNGIERVGGEKWWLWRRTEHSLHAEWIEMKKDYNERKRTGVQCDRVILYVHGGAYFFGSVDEHRYQMQRHARKLKARVLAPRYRLAPQFPFPCGLYDCIASYFYLLEHFEPSQILFAGDSAGGGMVLSMLVTLRDQGCPLPAGTILLSPWVDLTHSFPSTSGNGQGDYIPPHGFHHKPSMAWPPPPQTEQKAKKLERKFTQPMEQPFEVAELSAETGNTVSAKASKTDLREQVKKLQPNLNQLPGMGERLEIDVDGKLLELKEQIQLYAKNDLLTHPLVSPVQQPSLGGLPPMLIQVGGAELLRDEQIYLAHKAASPRRYVPNDAIMSEYDPQRIVLNQYPPTDVQLQVWEDLCHVPHTLSFTRPAKYMYRSVAQFGAWALARAQHKGIEILDDDAISIISNKSDGTIRTQAGDAPSAARKTEFGSIGEGEVSASQFQLSSIGAVGKAGDDLPAFVDHMIRQRVNRHGVIFPLPHESQIACLQLDPSTIGTIKAGPVRKWLAKRLENEQKFANEYKKLLKKRAKELKEGYDAVESGENPPATALYLRRKRGLAPEEKKKGKSWGLAMWSGWGSSHDESTIQREQQALDDKAHEPDRPGSAATSTATGTTDAGGSIDTAKGRAADGRESAKKKESAGSGKDGTIDAVTKANRRRSSASVLARPRSLGQDHRPRSPYRQVKDVGQTSADRNSATSPVLGAGAFDGGNSSRRSSQTSATLKFSARPISVAGPLPAGASRSQLHHVQTAASQSMTALVPSASDTNTGKDAVKVPGTVATFLNPDGNRPHNGMVAYPFKLRAGQDLPGRASPNPSTMTLDSNSSDRESILPRDGVAAVPTNDNGAGELSQSAAQRREAVTGNNELMHVTNGLRVEKMSENRHLETSLLVDGVSIARGVSRDELDPYVHVPLSSARPVSVLSEDPAFDHLKSPAEHSVSPVPSESSLPLETAATKSPPPVKSRFQQSQQTRDSRLGFLGADGMPLSAFPETTNLNATATDSSPKPAPFKIRNPVFDARAVPAQIPEDAPTQQQQQPVTTSDAVKAPPFKMRHTIYDAKVAPLSSKPQAEQAAAVSTSDDAAANGTTAGAQKEVTPPTSSDPSIVTQPSALPALSTQLSPISPISPLLPPSHEKEVVIATSDSAPTVVAVPPHTNITLPTIESPSPVTRPNSDIGPPPPPKDDPLIEQQTQQRQQPPMLRTNPGNPTLNGGGYSLMPQLRSMPSSSSMNSPSSSPHPSHQLRSSPSASGSLRNNSLSSASGRIGSISGSIKRKPVVPGSKFAADPARTMTALEAAGLAPATGSSSSRSKDKEKSSGSGWLGKLSFERKASVPSIEEQVQRGTLVEMPATVTGAGTGAGKGGKS